MRTGSKKTDHRARAPTDGLIPGLPSPRAGPSCQRALVWGRYDRDYRSYNSTAQRRIIAIACPYMLAGRTRAAMCQTMLARGASTHFFGESTRCPPLWPSKQFQRGQGRGHDYLDQMGIGPGWSCRRIGFPPMRSIVLPESLTAIALLENRRRKLRYPFRKASSRLT